MSEADVKNKWIARIDRDCPTPTTITADRSSALSDF